MHWVEYCNGTLDTYYANLRRSHGYEEPFGVKFWGLGNEMVRPLGRWKTRPRRNMPIPRFNLPRP